MVDNQHQKIKGYRDLSESEIALMNEVKDMAERVGALVQKMRDLSIASKTADLSQMLDGRWVSIGATDLQTGFMALTRAIARPTTF